MEYRRRSDVVSADAGLCVEVSRSPTNTGELSKIADNSDCFDAKTKAWMVQPRK